MTKKFETREEPNIWLAVLTLLSIPFALLLRALVLVKFWNWFVVPLGAAYIGYAHSLALSSLITYVIWYKGVPKDSEDNLNDKMLRSLGLTIIAPMLILGWGWLLQIIAF